jgi:mRNA-degrading endonuclease RelE of RelBE toxin-antitoxin system
MNEEKLSGKGDYRIRQGDYRMVYGVLSPSEEVAASTLIYGLEHELRTMTPPRCWASNL